MSFMETNSMSVWLVSDGSLPCHAMLATLVTVANAVVLDKRVFWGGAAITELGLKKQLPLRLPLPHEVEVKQAAPHR